MAQLWQAIVGSTTYDVSGGTFSWRLTASGTGLPPVRRLTQRSPQQHGHTDLGFRYDAREMRLGYIFSVGSDASADVRRDDLYEIWKALESTPIKLRVTRDDATVYQIDGYVTGVVDMTDDPSERIGSSQRFVVSLQCPDPMWYNPTQASTSFTSADNPDWWLAFGTISPSNVLLYKESPAQGEDMPDFTSIADGNPWSVFFKTNVTAIPPASIEYGFVLWNADPSDFALITTNGAFAGNAWQSGAAFLTNVWATGEHDYFLTADGTTYTSWRDTGSTGTLANSWGIDGTSAKNTWRSYFSQGYFTPSIPYFALYDVELSTTQKNALISATSSSPTSLAASKTITYTGSFSEYPVITITGPVTDPVFTNVSTGEVLDFTGVTISGGDTYTIDCRFGYKTVKNTAGTNKIAELTAASDLATFHLGAAPEVSAGANAFTLSGTSIDANTQVTVAYYNRYVGL